MESNVISLPNYASQWGVDVYKDSREATAGLRLNSHAIPKKTNSTITIAEILKKTKRDSKPTVPLKFE